jgi:hypothetical protein
MGKGQGLDPTTAKGYTAQGYYQMLNTNWRRLAPGLGITTPNAMASTKEEQTQVALALMRERPGAGVGHWANFNPSLKAALARGERAGAWAEGLPGGGEADRTALNTSAVDRMNGSGGVSSTGKLTVDVRARQGDKVEYAGTGLLRPTEMMQSRQMEHTQSGPSVASAAQQYMEGAR